MVPELAAVLCVCADEERQVREVFVRDVRDDVSVCVNDGDFFVVLVSGAGLFFAQADVEGVGQFALNGGAGDPGQGMESVLEVVEVVSEDVVAGCDGEGVVDFGC